MRTPVTVVTGLHRDEARPVARRLVGDDPTRVLVEHDLAQVTEGLVGRTEAWGDGTVAASVVELAHGCVSCTLREDVLPALVDLAGGSRRAAHIVLLLPEVVEPASLVEAFHGWPLPGLDVTAALACRISRIVAVVRADGLLPTIADGLTLAETGRVSADVDDRTAGEVLVRQVETADVVVATDPGPTERALVRRLNPTARVIAAHDVAADVLPEDVFDLDSALDRGDPSVIPAGPAVQRDGDVWSLVWRSPVPLHPLRLDGVLDEVSDTTLRSRGAVWLAGHADTIVGWDGVGPRVSLGAVGAWLEGGDPGAWDHAHPHHRTRAQLDWDPRFGDRLNEIVLTGVGHLPHRAVDALEAALLTDAELTASLDGRLPVTPDHPFTDVYDRHDHGGVGDDTVAPRERDAPLPTTPETP